MERGLPNENGVQWTRRANGRLAEYWVRFIDEYGRVLSAARIICVNDDEAAGRALSIFKPGMGFGYQVVEGTRIVKTSGTTTITK
jgi:hypothetical protein